MITYGIGVLPLIRELRDSHPRVTQPWYADDARVGRKFQQILEHFRDLQAQGPARGYYADPNKSILVVAPGNVSRAEEHFWGLGIRVVTGHRYLGGYIGDREAEGSWLEAKIKGWTESVAILAGVARNYPQSDYAVLQKSLQKEWEFMQWVTPGVGNSFGPVDTALKETLVSALFEGLREGVPERGVTRLTVKQAELALPYPYQTAPENWTASYVITGHLVAALRGQVEFRTADQSACLREGRTAVRRRGQRRAEEALTAVLEGALVLQARRLRRATKTGAWLTVQQSTGNGLEMGAQEWRDALFLWYGLKPQDLPSHCDGRQAKFLISHALDYKKGGLFTARPD